MDIFKILSFLQDNNIKLDEIVSMLSSIFGNSKKVDAPPPTEKPTFDASNPYWSMPNYTQNAYINNTNAQNAKTNSSSEYQTQNSNLSNINDIVKLLQLLKPLFKSKAQASLPAPSMQQFESEILKLKKTE